MEGHVRKGCCRTSSKALNTALIFDTANYGQGTSELRLGKALKSTDRSQLVINTKFGHTDGGIISVQITFGNL
jgi:hypothetical protein